jgi:hypothetical protein
MHICILQHVTPHLPTPSGQHGSLPLTLGHKGIALAHRHAALLVEAKLESLETCACDFWLPTRNALLDLFIPSDTVIAEQRRTVLKALLHGHPSSLFVEWHDPDPNADLDKWARLVARTLLPGGVPIFNRNRWIRNLASLGCFGLLLNFHRLLQRAVPLWLANARGKPLVAVRPDREEADDLVADNTWEPSEDEQEGCEGQADLIDRQSRKQPGEDDAAFNKRQKTDAASFAESLTADADLTVLVLVLGPHAHLMDRMLKLSSKEWELKALVQAQENGGSMRTRIQMYHNGAVTADAFIDLSQKMCQERAWGVLSMKQRTWHTFGMAFGLIARSAAGLDHLLRSRHRGYPFKLFSLLEDDPLVAAASILEDPPCVRCTFTNKFLGSVAKRAHRDGDGEIVTQPSAESLADPTTRVTLLVVALTVKTDTSRIECRHAAIRRFLNATTHHRSTEIASASFVLCQQRVLFHTGKPPLQASKVRKHIAKQKVDRRGGGGRQRFFISQRLRGKPLPPDRRSEIFQDLAEQYKQLSAEQLSELDDHARAGTIAHAAGGSSFGPAPYARARSRANREALADVLQQRLQDCILSKEGVQCREPDIYVEGPREPRVDVASEIQACFSVPN